MKPSSFGAAPALVSGITFPDSGSRGLDFFYIFEIFRYRYMLTKCQK